MPQVPDASVAAGAGLRLPLGAPALGTLLADKYLLDGVLGVGGMGVVYRGRHTLLGVAVAVKIILPEFAERPEFVARFANEAKAAARIQSDHIARVNDVGTTSQGISYLVMDLLEGEDLGNILALEGPQPLGRCIDWMLQAIAGLADAHHVGIVHRDLKPSNLFLSRRAGKPDRVKICDFGISKTSFEGAGQQITATNSMLGSPAYMAPEQLRSSRNVDHRADIWSLGIILYELCSGAPPFAGENVGSVFAAILETDPQPLRSFMPSLPEEIDQAVQRCLKKNPNDRFSNVTELGEALARFATEEHGREALRRSSAISQRPPHSSRNNVAFQATTPTNDSGQHLAASSSGRENAHPSGVGSNTPASFAGSNATQKLGLPPPVLNPAATTTQHPAVSISSSSLRSDEALSRGGLRSGSSAVWFVAAMATMLVIGGGLTLSATRLGKSSRTPAASASASPTMTLTLAATTTTTTMIPAEPSADIVVPTLADASGTTTTMVTTTTTTTPTTTRARARTVPTPEASTTLIASTAPAPPPPPPPPVVPATAPTASGIYTDPWKH